MFITCSKEQMPEIKEIIQTVFDNNNFDSYIHSYIEADSCRIGIFEIGWFSLLEEIEEVCARLQEMLSKIKERYPHVQIEGEVSIGDKNYRMTYSFQSSQEHQTVTAEESVGGIPVSECWFPYWMNGNYGLDWAGFTTREECGAYFKVFKKYMKDFLEDKDVSFDTFIKSDLLEQYFEENKEALEELCCLCEEEDIAPPYTAFVDEFKDFCVSAWKKYNGEELAFVITGKLKLFENRDEFVEYIEELGGKVTGSVSAKTDYLICNDTASTSSKMKKAKELGIPVITEREFIERFGDPDDFGLDDEEDEEDEDDD